MAQRESVCRIAMVDVTDSVEKSGAGHGSLAALSANLVRLGCRSSAGPPNGCDQPYRSYLDRSRGRRGASCGRPEGAAPESRS